MTTLSQYIEADQQLRDGVGKALLQIAEGTKTVADGVARAGLSSMLGQTGATNVQGEAVQKLDEYADDVFIKLLGDSGEFAALVSEEQESVVSASAASAQSRYVIALDPLDGSSNIDSNVSIGTIFGISPRVTSGTAGDQSDFMQNGRQLIAAGYTIYGSSTMLVLSAGAGVQGFTLDQSNGEFVLTHPDMRMPSFGKIYSCNEGNFGKWSKGVQGFVDHVKQVVAGDSKRPFSQRYVGSMVADLHRTLLKGGIFMYPADGKNTSGKLRLLYECAPMAFVVEQAGGAASDGRQPILDILPQQIHQRSPIFIGSSENVQELERFVRDLD